MLIAVNPFQRVSIYGPEIIQAYSGRRRGDLDPHLFAIAEDAYSHMKRDLQGQTIIVSGERYVTYLTSFLQILIAPLAVVLERLNPWVAGELLEAPNLTVFLPPG